MQKKNEGTALGTTLGTTLADQGFQALLLQGK
jgi:hypothetical protein